MNNKRIASYGQMSIQNLKLVISLSRADMKQERMVSEICRKHSLTLMQFAVLEVLYHKGDMKIGEIIEAILSTSGNMTVVVNNLVKGGLVAKRVCPDDNRAFIVSITESGIKTMDEVFPEYIKLLDSFMAKLSTDEKRILISLLKKLQGKTNNSGANPKGEHYE